MNVWIVKCTFFTIADQSITISINILYLNFDSWTWRCNSFNSFNSFVWAWYPTHFCRWCNDFERKKNGAKVIQTLFPKLKFLLRTVLRLSFVFRIMQSIVDEWYQIWSLQWESVLLKLQLFRKLFWYRNFSLSWQNKIDCNLASICFGASQAEGVRHFYRSSILILYALEHFFNAVNIQSYKVNIPW